MSSPLNTPAVHNQLGSPELDEFRARDFQRLEHDSQRYFDYTGSGLYGESQVVRHLELLRTHTFGNPHSRNPTSAPMTELLDSTRDQVLEYFGATEHECIFTSNASAALKLVGESFPFGAQRGLLLSADNHNSVNGIRELARRAGAPTWVTPVVAPELRLDPDRVVQHLGARDRAGLFAFPAQSNYSGVQHPLGMVDEAHRNGWRVLVDAAAFVPTNPLDLSETAADFAVVSFYKMFGYPTGVGALIVRRDALRELERPWFAGGTISMVSVAADRHRLSAGHAGFEDGTPNFLSIPAVAIGLDVLCEVGIDAVHTRVQAATAILLDAFTDMAHSNGHPVVRILGPTDTHMRGGTLTFNVFDPSGTMVHDRLVQEAAAKVGISLRSGCFCNPGAGESARGLVAADMAPFFERADAPDFCDLDDALWKSRGSGASALRASVGWVTNVADLDALIGFLEGFADRSAGELGDPLGVEPLRGPDSP